MPTVRRSTVIELPPDRAFDLWVDTSRWPTFVDGFANIEREDVGWPAEGAKLVWRSTPAGRGRVTEKVLRAERPVLLSTSVLEEKLSGTQRVTFEPAEDGLGVVVAAAGDAHRGGGFPPPGTGGLRLRDAQERGPDGDAGGVQELSAAEIRSHVVFSLAGRVGPRAAPASQQSG